jgi:YegS/Rv2252/BmrU family lipid kinase
VKIVVIVNSRSGPGHENGIAERLANVFAAGGVEAQISLAANGAEVLRLAQAAAKSEADVVVAGGGDGTVNSIASAIIDTDKALGVLPFGTMNHFAKDLLIPLELEAAVETILRGKVTQVDIGAVNDHIFINNSSLGLYPSIVREREKHQKLGWGKWPAFVWAAFGVLRRYPFLDIQIGVDGSEQRRRTPFIFIGNNEYEMETLNIGHRACLDKGELSLYITNRISRFDLIRLAFHALFGGLRQEKDFFAMCTREVRIDTKHTRLRVALDGEVTVLTPPLHYRTRPGALRVLTPASTNEAKS